MNDKLKPGALVIVTKTIHLWTKTHKHYPVLPGTILMFLDRERSKNYARPKYQFLFGEQVLETNYMPKSFDWAIQSIEIL